MNLKTYTKSKFPTGYSIKCVPKDIFSGIIVALVSIPISMGYAQIAGLPMIYGLYGSLIPILIYGITTTSYDFVFGVDAAPAALAGGTLTALGIELGSQEAINAIPVLTFLVALWLLLFYFMKAGRAVKYISVPVMGGFITGICLEIITMQIPKLFGGTAGSGEFPELVFHIFKSFSNFNGLSFVLGLATIIIILVFRKIMPKLPMSIIMLILGAFLTIHFSIDKYGVRLLPETSAGLPLPKLLAIDFTILPDLGFAAMTIALVIMSETLLASRSNAISDGYDLDTNREVLGYALANISSAMIGCCPVNASVSRTSIVRQFGGRSQIMSISASISMAMILIFATDYIKYLPVPVLTGIVIAALLSACEFHLAKRLIETSKRDFIIFISAMFGVLFFGTIYGVMIGIILSFFAIIRQAVSPPRSFVGIRPGHEGFYSLKAHPEARPIKDVVIYRFGGNLFFANIDSFISDIEGAIDENTHVVIVNGSGINNVDITATDRVMQLYKKLKKKGIAFFIAENDGTVNKELIQFGAGELIELGNVRRDLEETLEHVNIYPPYSYVDINEYADKTEI